VRRQKANVREKKLVSNSLCHLLIPGINKSNPDKKYVWANKLIIKGNKGPP
jgi:hypothetical protein